MRYGVLLSGKLALGTLTFMAVAPTSEAPGPRGTQGPEEQLSPWYELGGSQAQGPPYWKSLPTFPRLPAWLPHCEGRMRTGPKSPSSEALHGSQHAQPPTLAPWDKALHLFGRTTFFDCEVNK